MYESFTCALFVLMNWQVLFGDMLTCMYILCIILISRVIKYLVRVVHTASYALSCYVFYFSAMLAFFIAPVEASHSTCVYFHLL